MKPVINRRIIGVICTLVFFIGTEIADAQNDSLKEVQELVGSQEYEAAIGSLNVLAESAGEDQLPLIYNAIGWSYLKLGNYAQAEYYLSRSLANAEKNGDEKVAAVASNNLGILKYLGNDLEGSAAQFATGVSSETPTASIYSQLIESKARQLQAQEAVNTGVKQRLQRDFDGAIESYDAALELQPHNAAALEFKGYALLRKGSYKEALEHLEAAREIDPGRTLLNLNLLKAQCGLESEEGVQSVMASSGLPKNQFVEWWRVDGEFRRMCAQNHTLTSLVGK